MSAYDKGFKWRSQDVEEVRRLANLGLSPTQISIQTGHTKNSIIGISHRKCIVFKNNKKCKDIKVKPVRKNFGFMKLKKSVKLPDESQIHHKPVPFPPDINNCKFIIGESRNMLCCGMKTDGHSYCDNHRLILYQPHIPRK